MEKKEFTLEKKYRNVIETEGWSIGEIDSNGNVTLSNESPAGEDLEIVLSVVNIKGDINNYGFDPEEHVSELLEAKRNGFGGVPSLDVLVEDANAIEEMISDLSFAIDNVDTINEYLD